MHSNDLSLTLEWTQNINYDTVHTFKLILLSFNKNISIITILQKPQDIYAR